MWSKKIKKIGKKWAITQLMNNKNVYVGFLGKLSKPKKPINFTFFMVMPFLRK
jgi:hypothetical protein